MMIAERLRGMGLSVALLDFDHHSDALKTQAIIENAKVFVACVSNEYSSSKECVMHFQCAKKVERALSCPCVLPGLHQEIDRSHLAAGTRRSRCRSPSCRSSSAAAAGSGR